MFGPWLSFFAWLKQRTPSSLKALTPHANFITLHCMYAIQEKKVDMHAYEWVDGYIISWTLIGSVIMYGNGRIPYIDALFFASGAATQSGLNTYVKKSWAHGDRKLTDVVESMSITSICISRYARTTRILGDQHFSDQP